MAELALDYLKSGMYDRAESAYEQLSTFKGREVEALEALMHIYCTEHEWKKAVEAAERLQKAAKICMLRSVTIIVSWLIWLDAPRMPHARPNS